MSRDGKTYTFTIRKRLRFSDGKPLTARNFAHAIERTISPRLKGFGGPDVNGLGTVVGAQAFWEGKAKAIPGVRASGLRLTFELTQPTPDFLARMTRDHLCPVPLDLPVNSEGVVLAPLPGSGPYYVAEFVQDRRVVLKRNRFYRGDYPHHVDEIVFTSALRDPHEIVRGVERNQSDAARSIPADMVGELAHRYGVNKSRFRIVPGSIVWYLYLNLSRPLFKNNARLRRAVNFAVDRGALLRQLGPHFGNTTDQYLPPRSPGFRNALIYPLNRADLKSARTLAAGHLRGGKAVLYGATDYPSGAYDPPGAPLAQVVQENLSKIGIQVEIEEFPISVLDEKTFTPGEPWDITIGSWQGIWMDPSWYVDLAPQFLFPIESRAYVNRLKRANSLSGAARYRAYGNVDVWLARNLAPLVPFAVQNDAYFFSKRVGCFAANFEGWDIASACLKR